MPALITCPHPAACGVTSGHYPGSDDAARCAARGSFPAHADAAPAVTMASSTLRSAAVIDCPDRVSFDELEQYVDGYESWLDASRIPSLRQTSFELMQVRVECVQGPTTAFDFCSDMDFDDDDEAEETLETYQGLAEAINRGDEIPPLVIYAHPAAWHEGMELLDGNHRAGLALSEGVQVLWAYVGVQEGSEIPPALLV